MTAKKEHKFAIRHADDSSALFKHVSEQGHTINWDSSTIVYPSQCNFKRKIVESALIASTPNFNISKGQWTPDIISLSVVQDLLPGQVNPDPTSHPSTGHVT